MKLSERLDAQLSARLANGPATIHAAPTDPSDTEETLPQLLAADVLAQWRSATPRARYADALEARLLAHATTVVIRGEGRMPATAPTEDAAAGSASASSWSPAIVSWRRESGSRSSAQSVRKTARGGGHMRPFRSLAVATVALLALGAGVVVAAASAGPGSPLYGLHRAEQNIRVGLATTPAERVRLRLAYAQSDLGAIEKSLARHATGATYTDALGAFQSDLQAIGTDWPALPPGREREQLAAQVTALETQGRSDLLGALPTLSWPGQLKTTTVLGSLGVSIPTITQATITRTLGSGEHDTRIVVVGNNFQQGAVVEVNGEVAGTVLSQSSTQLVVELDPNYPVARASHIGVSNPDGTAADTTRIVLALDTGNGKGSGSGVDETPGPAATVTSGNGNGNGGGHPGGGSHGTPTPSR